jgi:hypothetical protein
MDGVEALIGIGLQNTRLRNPPVRQRVEAIPSPSVKILCGIAVILQQSTKALAATHSSPGLLLPGLPSGNNTSCNLGYHQIKLFSFCFDGEELMRLQIDRPVLEMALIGYEAERQKIEEKIAAIQRQLGGRPRGAAPVVGTDGTGPKRRMSAAGRKRIAAAQKKRWAAFRAKHGEGSATRRKVAKKRTLSPAAKAKLVANLAKARAARAAKKAAAA